LVVSFSSGLPYLLEYMTKIFSWFII
jgi:hypothetical protein